MNDWHYLQTWNQITYSSLIFTSCLNDKSPDNRNSAAEKMRCRTPSVAPDTQAYSQPPRPISGFRQDEPGACADSGPRVGL